MPQFAANVSILFPDVPFVQRFQVARECGFDAVEFRWPSPQALDGLSLAEFAKRVKATGLSVVLINFDAGDLPAGDRGLAGDPEGVDRFRANVPVALELASALGCRKLNALAGNARAGHPREELRELVVESVRFAAESADRHGASVMIEAVNSKDNPRYLLPTTESVLALIHRIGRPNVRYQLDVYHAAMAGEDPLQAITQARGLIGHVQVADVPGRHEPGTGTLPFDAILSALPASGYAGPIALEYVPVNPPARDFSFLRRWTGRLSEVS